MKTLLLLIIGALFGIWFYNSHPALIPDNLTKTVDASVDWVQDLWSGDQPTAETNNKQSRQGTPEVDEPAPQEPQLSISEPDSRQNTPAQRTQNSTEPQTPRGEAMSTYSRVIRMIDQTP